MKKPVSRPPRLTGRILVDLIRLEVALPSEVKKAAVGMGFKPHSKKFRKLQRHDVSLVELGTPKFKAIRSKVEYLEIACDILPNPGKQFDADVVIKHSFSSESELRPANPEQPERYVTRYARRRPLVKKRAEVAAYYKSVALAAKAKKAKAAEKELRASPQNMREAFRIEARLGDDDLPELWDWLDEFKLGVEELPEAIWSFLGDRFQAKWPVIRKVKSNRPAFRLPNEEEESSLQAIAVEVEVDPIMLKKHPGVHSIQKALRECKAEQQACKDGQPEEASKIIRWDNSLDRRRKKAVVPAPPVSPTRRIKLGLAATLAATGEASPKAAAASASGGSPARDRAAVRKSLEKKGTAKLRRTLKKARRKKAKAGAVHTRG